jgi:hypothetical protein
MADNSAGVMQPGELCGRVVFYSSRKTSVSTLASGSVVKSSQSSHSSSGFAWNDSQSPFSKGEAGFT